jgi:nitroreductase
MKSTIKRLLPNFLLSKLRFLRTAPSIVAANYYDFNRYTTYSSAVSYKDSEEKLRAVITAAYHGIEKGLSLSEPRLGFGKDGLSRLVGYIDEVFDRFGAREYLVTPISVIGAYVAFHESRDFPVSAVRGNWERLERRIRESTTNLSQKGGVIEASLEQINAATHGVTSAFFETRYSCRQYQKIPLTQLEIETAVKAAQKAPAVCNRQSGKIHAFLRREDIDIILNLQGGAHGFSQDIPTLFCVTTDLRNFQGVGERYQGWIDGGLFAMSFILGLHMQGIGSCCLNWSKDSDQDKEMRKLIRLDSSETILMFIAAGHIPEKLNVARSIRKPISDVLNISTLTHITQK